MVLLLAGVKVTVRGQEVTCKARLLFTLAHLPAKASLTNMMQFNGKFGCPACKLEGKQVCSYVKYSTIHVHICRFQLEEVAVELMAISQLH